MSTRHVAGWTPAGPIGGPAAGFTHPSAGPRAGLALPVVGPRPPQGGPRPGRRGARRGSGVRRALRLTVARHRRPLLVAFLLAIVALAARCAAPETASTVQVLVAARDLPAGHVLQDDDLRTAGWPPDVAPRRPVTTAVGRRLASPVRLGEPITDVRLVGRDLLTGQPAGTVAIPVRLADATASAIVQPGDRIDVIAGPAQDIGGVGDGAGIPGRRLAEDALVLAVPGTGGATASESTPGGLGGLTGSGLDLSGSADAASSGVLILAVDGYTAQRLASAQSGQPLTIALRPAEGSDFDG